jgi:hypothetical protein
MHTRLTNPSPSLVQWLARTGDSTMEHRWGERIAADLGVRLIGGSASTSLGAGRLLNASVSGGFIRTALRLPFLATVYLVPLSMERPDDWPEELRGYVVRGTRSGLGIEWCEHLAPAELVALCDVLSPDLSSKAVHGGNSHA